MMVTFISQCEKKALMRTRRVLDAFANRIGDNTWQTVITQEGLNAVKKLLRKTASKNTAVSCHWIRSRSRSDLLWVVGSKQKFDYQGIVPVNTTIKNILNNQWQTNWHYLPLIRVLTALAALFHDWGKATVCFQKKLRSKKSKSDPLRHEWISCLLLHAYIQSHGVSGDKAWLEALHDGNIDETKLKETLRNYERPLEGLPLFASMVMWLVLTHHRLPLPDKGIIDKNKGEEPRQTQLFQLLDAAWGYENASSQTEKEDCFAFEHGLLSNSQKWLKEVKKWAGKALKQQHLLEDMEEGQQRLVLLHSRLCLMLGDHGYSSLPNDKTRQSNVNLYANTEGNKLKQRLDEHLVGVHQYALLASNELPKFETDMPWARDIRVLQKKSYGQFSWQDKAVTKIRDWREQNNLTDHDDQFGFFAVNMASTGKGKTLANAKIMQALSPNGNDLRYVLALGLRTLTLQTGDEYKNRIGLEEELAVLVGSKAVVELYNQKDEQHFLERGGSESMESLLEGELDYDCPIEEQRLNTILNTPKNRQLLYAPVLVCTIDHIMGATETTRGGRYILPTLRLMSSDLVIDEVDDFDGEDLKAIGRLIHLAGMLGRKVMLSSATIPPGLAQGFCRAYQQGWHIFASSRGMSKNIGYAGIDEYRTELALSDNNYDEFHQGFVTRRVASLRNEQVRRKAAITALDHPKQSDEETLKNMYYRAVKQAALDMHKTHRIQDKGSTKQVSFGVVRVANIAPCVALTQYLLATDWPEGIDVKIMAYHSQQVLLMRNAQEKHLDRVLRDRKDPQTAFAEAHIRRQLSASEAKDVIYILVATPVEEVGRDHDFDWAVIEPSSYRSIIQLAGRVLRHRSTPPSGVNIALLQYNLKGFIQKFGKTGGRKPVFIYPGYETDDNLLPSHDLKQLVDQQAIANSVDAVPRVCRPTADGSLIALEHEVIDRMLNSPDKRGAGELEGWLSGSWWLTAIPQFLYRFRHSSPTTLLYLMFDNDNKPSFYEKDERGQTQLAEEKFRIRHADADGGHERLWWQQDYAALLENQAQTRDMDLQGAALQFGEIAIQNAKNGEFEYSSQFGLVRKSTAQ